MHGARFAPVNVQSLVKDGAAPGSGRAFHPGLMSLPCCHLCAQHCQDSFLGTDMMARQVARGISTGNNLIQSLQDTIRYTFSSDPSLS